MLYKEGRLEVTSQVRAVPLGQKRKRGRPKALGNCLMRSPPQSRLPLPQSPPEAQSPSLAASPFGPTSTPQPAITVSIPRKRKPNKKNTQILPSTTTPPTTRVKRNPKKTNATSSHTTPPPHPTRTPPTLPPAKRKSRMNPESPTFPIRKKTKKGKSPTLPVKKTKSPTKFSPRKLRNRNN